MVQMMVHGYVGYGGCKLYFSSHFQAIRHGYVMGVGTCTNLPLYMLQIIFQASSNWPQVLKMHNSKSQPLVKLEFHIC